MTPLKLYCPMCRALFDWNRGYGREIRCCDKSCHDEVEWRRTLSILGKEYYPDPTRHTEIVFRSTPDPQEK